ncbi:MAG TPA: hypothetical protein VHG08_15580 [Longimicrobium sp.]|nr:hypothetical protein [Longimicrobium sp.]
MRRLLLTPLLALLVAASAQAQDTPEPFNIEVTYVASPRAVYMAAIQSLEREGYTIRARFLDAGLLTLPLVDRKSGADSLASQLYLELRPRGDTTAVSFQAHVAPLSGRPLRRDEQEKVTALAMTAQLTITAAIAATLEELPEHARQPDPREDSDQFGYGKRNPIRVGGGMENGSANQRRYLDGLRGPAGQPVRYFRLGSCCQFRTPHSPQGAGMLDAYQVHYEGLERPVLLYMDLYTPAEGAPAAPEGFTLASGGAPQASR